MNKKLLAAAISGALVAPIAAQAVEYKISGHVNRMIRFADNGKASDIQFTDNSASRTRFRFRGSGDIGRGMKAGIYIETSVASNISSKADLKEPSEGGNDTAFDIRHSALWFSGKWGKMSLGHTAPATDGMAHADQSGTALVDEVSSDELCTGCSMRTNAGGTMGVLSGIRTTIDGNRKDIIKYDSPALGPATIAASIGQQSYYDVAAFIDTNLGGGSLSLYGGYAREEHVTGSMANLWRISASYLFSQGTNITGAYGQKDFKTGPGAPSADDWFVKLGHKWGNNAVSVSYSSQEDGFVNGSTAPMWGLGFVHTIPKPGVELYAGFKQYQLDLSTAAQAAVCPGGAATCSTKDLNVFVVGSRIKFN